MGGSGGEGREGGRGVGGEMREEVGRQKGLLGRWG